MVTLVAMRSSGSWDDTAVTLPPGSWRNVLADGSQVVAGGTAVPFSQWLDTFPVAVLDRTDLV